jgi:hypothetical protein
MLSLYVYNKINTQHPVAGEEFTSSIDSMTYGDNLSKLFIVSVLGTRLLGGEKTFFGLSQIAAPRSIAF